MSWNIGDDRNLFLKLKKKLGLYHVELRSKPKDSPGKTTLTLVETQVAKYWKSWFKRWTFFFKWTLYNGRRKVCIIFQTDAAKANIVVYCYRNNTYLKDTEMDLKLTEYKKLLAKRVYLLSYIDIFYKRRIVLDETTVHIQKKLRQKRMFFSNKRFPIIPGCENVIWTQWCSQKPISKCMFLLGFWNFFTGDRQKSFIWWTHWLWKLLFGLCVSSLDEKKTACNITRCCWSCSIT